MQCAKDARHPVGKAGPEAVHQRREQQRSTEGNKIVIAKILARLLDVIRRQRWVAFETIVLSNPRTFKWLCNALAEYDQFDRATLLHECLKHSPPLVIVAKMLEMCPDPIVALRAQDCMGRSPLHIAAACDADPFIIKLLGNADPTVCDSLDEDGQTPLYLACDRSCTVANETGEDRQRNAPSYLSVRALLSESLRPALIEDKNGMSAIEYAILSDAPIDVVNLLQKVAMASIQDGHSENESNKSNKSNKLNKLSQLQDGTTPTDLDIVLGMSSKGVQLRSGAIFLSRSISL